MTEDGQQAGQLANILGVGGLPAALVPGTLKALNRLVGSAIEIPVAKLRQVSAKIDAQTASYQAVEAAIGSRAAELASSDPELSKRAAEALVRGTYRKQANREAVSAAMIEALHDAPNETPTEVENEVDDDWLNTFERYAEDATTERMQRLWGRVLAGEIRKPGRYSPRTLRFLSELSKPEAEEFATIAKLSFAGLISNASLPNRENDDIRHLLNLETAGLLTRDLRHTLTLKQLGDTPIVLPEDKSLGAAIISDGENTLLIAGSLGAAVATSVVVLTPLGTELVSLIEDYNPEEAARAFINGMPKGELMMVVFARLGPVGTTTPGTVIWQKTET